MKEADLRNPMLTSGRTVPLIQTLLPTALVYTRRSICNMADSNRMASVIFAPAFSQSCPGLGIAAVLQKPWMKTALHGH